MKKLESLSAKECEEQAEKEFKAAIRQHEKTIKEKKALKKKYEDMLAQVRAWVPPSKDHIEFKNFMESQIVGSIDFDCDLRYYEKHKPVKLTGAEWKKDSIETAARNIKYHAEGYEKEIEGNDKRNRWIGLLRNSLK